MTMFKINTEEKSPLLFVLDSNEDISRQRYFERSRFNGITTGATAVFTHFPNYIGTCWIATAVIALIFFMMILFVLSTLTAVSLRIPRCVASPDEPLNKTIHLVHLHGSKHPESNEIDIIKDLMTKYPQYNIRILSIFTEREKSKKLEQKINSIETATKKIELPTTTVAVTEKKRATKRRREVDFREANRFLDMLLRGKLMEKADQIMATAVETVATTEPPEKHIRTIEALVAAYPNITYQNTTFNQQFFASPLYPYYRFLNERIKTFAVRVLQIWQYGGISYDLQASVADVKGVTSNKFGKIQKFVVLEKNGIVSGNNDINQIEEEVVIVDEKGLHLESKVPCHAFFGQVLMFLRRANYRTTVKEIMQLAIRDFCKHYAFGLDYCNMYLNI